MNTSIYTTLQLKDIARSKRLNVTFGMSRIEVIELLNA